VKIQKVTKSILISQTFYWSQNNCICGHCTCKPKITKLQHIHQKGKKITY